MSTNENILKTMFENNAVVNSFVKVLLYEKTASIGVSQQTFEAMYTKYNLGQWTSVSNDWIQRVKYHCKPSTGEKKVTDINIAYYENDPVDVIAYRNKDLVKLYGSNPAFNAEITRYLVEECPPPGTTDKYHKLSIQSTRTFIRHSSSVKNVIWTYKFIVEWNGKSVKDAYTVKPIYKIRLELDARSVAITADMTKWLSDSLQNKINELIGSSTITKDVLPMITQKTNAASPFESLFLEDDEFANEDAIEEGGSVYDDDGDYEQTDYTSS